MRTGMQLNPGPVSILLLAVYLLITGIRIDPRDKDRPASDRLGPSA